MVKNVFFLLKKFALQSGLKNRYYYQKPLSFDQYLSNISKKLVQSSHFVEVFLTVSENNFSRKPRFRFWKSITLNYIKHS